MPDAPKRHRFAAPGARRFAAGALAGFVAVFGVLALRVHDGDDPALASVASKKAAVTTTTTTSSDDSTAATSSDDGSSAVTSTPSASTSAS